MDTEKDPAKKVKLNELYEQQKASADKANKHYEEVDAKKKEEDNAKADAEKRVEKFQAEFKKLKDKVAKAD